MRRLQFLLALFGVGVASAQTEKTKVTVRIARPAPASPHNGVCPVCFTVAPVLPQWTYKKVESVRGYWI